MSTSPSSSLTFVGIAVSKDNLQIALCPSQDDWTIANDQSAVADLTKRLQALARSASSSKPVAALNLWSSLIWRRCQSWANCPTKNYPPWLASPPLLARVGLGRAKATSAVGVPEFVPCCTRRR